MKRFYEEHTDKLFSMSHMAKLRVRVQILLLIFQILKNETHSKQMDRLMRVIYETLLDPSCLHSSITELFLELIYNAFKNDQSLTRVMAGLKRLLQNAIHAEANVAIAVLIFVNKLASSVTGLNQLLKNSFATEDFEDKEEVKPKTKSDADDVETLAIDNGGYDFLKRDPLYANANSSLLWEINYFTEHFHPTVRRFALDLRQNLCTKKIHYDSNPILDFSTASFLNRFSLKKPKAIHGANLQKLKDSNKLSRSRIEEPFSLQSVMAESTSGKEIRDDEEFMAVYFKHKLTSLDYQKTLDRRRQAKIGQKPLDEDEEDEYADDLFERELQKAEGKKRDIAFEEMAESEEGEEEDFNVDEFDDDIRDEGEEFMDLEDDGVTLKKRPPKTGHKKFKKANKKFKKK